MKVNIQSCFTILQEDQVSVELEIDHRIHRRLIGARGKAINKMMDEYKVDIRFPREEDSNPNLVVVTGDSENVDECCDYLKNLEEEYVSNCRLVDIEVHSRLISHKHKISRCIIKIGDDH